MLTSLKQSCVLIYIIMMIYLILNQFNEEGLRRGGNITIHFMWKTEILLWISQREQRTTLLCTWKLLVFITCLMPIFYRKKKQMTIRFGRRNSETQRPGNVQNGYGIFGASLKVFGCFWVWTHPFWKTLIIPARRWALSCRVSHDVWLAGKGFQQLVYCY